METVNVGMEEMNELLILDRIDSNNSCSASDDNHHRSDDSSAQKSSSNSCFYNSSEPDDAFELDIDAMLGETDDSNVHLNNNNNINNHSIHSRTSCNNEEVEEDDYNRVPPAKHTGESSNTINNFSSLSAIETTPSEIKHTNICYSVFSTQGNRTHMLDKFSSFVVHDNLSLYAVFDGHGNDAIACYLESCLLPLISAHPLFQFDVCAAISSTFKALDELFVVEPQFAGSGCVCVCAVLVAGVMYIVNLGDCRAVVFDRAGNSQQLSFDHNPATREDEVQRIANSKGVCLLKGSQMRVAGELNVTRAFGDIRYKPALIAEPEITVYNLHSLMQTFNFEDIFLVLATDGLWNDFGCQSNNKQETGSTEGICAAQGYAFFPENSVNSIISQKECLRDNTTVLAVNLSYYYLNLVNSYQQSIIG